MRPNRSSRESMSRRQLSCLPMRAAISQNVSSEASIVGGSLAADPQTGFSQEAGDFHLVGPERQNEVRAGVEYRSYVRRIPRPESCTELGKSQSSVTPSKS